MCTSVFLLSVNPDVLYWGSGRECTFIQVILICNSAFQMETTGLDCKTQERTSIPFPGTILESMNIKSS